jgi:hypothetical protein
VQKPTRENIEFNLLKHHLGFIKNFISENKGETISSILHAINKIGHSNTDVYIGRLSPSQIISEILSLPEISACKTKEDFKKLIVASGKDYFEKILSDGSAWTFRLGEDDVKYIHVHPSRKSPFTVRVRASSLKTAVTYHIYYNGHLETEETERKINFLRKNYLNLPPIKSLKNSQALKYLFEILAS